MATILLFLYIKQYTQTKGDRVLFTNVSSYVYYFILILIMIIIKSSDINCIYFNLDLSCILQQLATKYLN